LKLIESELKFYSCFDICTKLISVFIRNSVTMRQLHKIYSIFRNLYIYSILKNINSRHYFNNQYFDIDVYVFFSSIFRATTHYVTENCELEQLLESSINNSSQIHEFAHTRNKCSPVYRA